MTGAYSPNKDKNGHRWQLEQIFGPEFCIKCKNYAPNDEECKISDEQYVRNIIAWSRVVNQRFDVKKSVTRWVEYHARELDLSQFNHLFEENI